MRITRDDFREAVLKANEKFTEIASKDDEKNPGGAMTTLLMGLQNVAFGALIEETLFGEQEEN